MSNDEAGAEQHAKDPNALHQEEGSLWDSVRGEMTRNAHDIAFLFCSIIKGKVAKKSPLSGWRSKGGQDGDYSGFEDAVQHVAGIVKSIVSRLNEDFLIADRSVPIAIRKMFNALAGGEYASLQREAQVLLVVLKYFTAKTMITLLERERSEIDMEGGLDERSSKAHDKRMDFLERHMRQLKQEIAGFGAGVKASALPEVSEFKPPVQMIKELRSGLVKANVLSEELDNKADRLLGDPKQVDGTNATWAPQVINRAPQMDTGKHVASMMRRIAARVASAFCLELK